MARPHTRSLALVVAASVSVALVACGTSSPGAVPNTTAGGPATSGQAATGPAAPRPAAKRPPSPSDLVDVRQASSVAISPDRRVIAFVVTEPATAEASAENQDIWVVPADGSSPARALAATPARETMPAFSPDGRSVAYLSNEGKHGNQIWLRRVDDAVGAVRVTGSPGAVSRFGWSPDGRSIAFVAAPPPGRSGWQPPTDANYVGRSGAVRRPAQLWEVSAEGGEVRQITDFDFGVRDLAWSPGSDAFAVLVDPEPRDPGRGKRVVVVDRKSGEVLRTLTNRAEGPGTRTQVLDWSPDGSAVAFASAEANRIGYWIGVVPSAGGGEVRHLLRHHEGTVMKAVWAGDSKHLVAQVFEDTRSVVRRVEVATGETTIIGETLDAYPDFAIDESAGVVACASSRHDSPAEVWVIGTGGPKRLTQLNPQLEGIAFGEIGDIEWKSGKDGETVRGLLVTPPGYRAGKPYPAIVLVHGGPHFHWHRGWLAAWDDWAQLLASHGYVILAPNPRGSTGRTIEWTRAIQNDLGGIDLEDVLDGVEALVDRGIADPERIGVGGWSYGGFMTASAITRSSRFRAAVVGAGISDLFSFANTPGNGPGWQSFFPDVAVRQPAEYDRRSPARNLGGVKTATLIVHGERDAKIPVTQAWELYHGLKNLDGTVDLIIYPREGHGLTERAHRIDLLEQVLSWFSEHIPVGAEGTAGER